MTIDQDNRLFILQASPERNRFKIINRTPAGCAPSAFSEAGFGPDRVVSGLAYVLRSEHNLSNIPIDLSPSDCPAMCRSSAGLAIITDIGSVTGHMAPGLGISNLTGRD
jgi:hypothetical protein